MKHIVTIVAIICLTIIAGLSLAAGEEPSIVITASTAIGVLGGYLARQNSKNKQA